MGQVSMVIDLNKCIGCQTCTTACKSLWTDEPGQEHMLWNNVETKPGPGYPRYWEEGGGGFDANGNLKRDGLMTTKEDHGEEIVRQVIAYHLENRGKDHRYIFSKALHFHKLLG